MLLRGKVSFKQMDNNLLVKVIAPVAKGSVFVELKFNSNLKLVIKPSKFPLVFDHV